MELTQPQVIQLFRDFEEARELWGLELTTAILYVVLQFLGREAGLAPLQLISGLRSEREQAQLRRRWESGDRKGIAVPPALKSQHTIGKAFDVAAHVDIAQYGDWARQLGARWGGDFRRYDPNHFDTRRA